MALFELEQDRLTPVQAIRFGEIGVTERGDLQRVLRDQIEVLVPDAMVLCEEFGDWEDSSRRIDLLALDKRADLVVVELKRTADGGHMELQAIRYAAMVSKMTFAQAVTAHTGYLSKRGMEGDAEQRILDFLSWEEPQESEFARSVRVVLASADFSREVTTSVLWLNEQGIDIRCVRLRPHVIAGRTLLDVHQVIPLPEAEEYQVRVREKERIASKQRRVSWTRDSLLSHLEASHGGAVRAVAEEFAELADELGDEIYWGHGRQFGGAVPLIYIGQEKYHLFRLLSNGRLVIPLDGLKRKPPFDDKRFLRQLADRWQAVDGQTVAAEDLHKRRRIPLSQLVDEDCRQRAKEVIRWMIDEIRRANAE